MSHLLYSSEEMYSSTELIRKSKTIFNKIINKEIDKAIIMRDGKPSFMLLDFDKYEKIMTEYGRLKNDKKNQKIKTKKIVEEKNDLVEPEINTEKEVVPEMEVLDDLDFDDDFKEEVKRKVLEKKKKQEIKEFWS